MTKYLMSVCYTADATPPGPQALESIMTDVEAVRDAMQSEGIWVFAGGLHDPATATVVTSRDGSVTTTDGPFIDTKEVIGGLTIIDVADLDTALGWAERLATATTCPIEIRPFMDEPGA